MLNSRKQVRRREAAWALGEGGASTRSNKKSSVDWDLRKLETDLVVSGAVLMRFGREGQERQGDGSMWERGETGYSVDLNLQRERKRAQCGLPRVPCGERGEHGSWEQRGGTGLSIFLGLCGVLRHLDRHHVVCDMVRRREQQFKPERVLSGQVVLVKPLVPNEA